MSIIEVFGEECRATAAVLNGLPEQDFARQTNCPPWSLKELVVHTRFSVTIPDPLPAPAANAKLCEAADYYRRPERDSDEYRTDNIRITQELAQRFPTGRSAATDFGRATQNLIVRLHGEDLGTLVRYGDSNALSLGDYLLTRLLALAAHSIDVAITLDQEPWTQSETARLLGPMLTSLLGREPPPALGWSLQDLLEIGTGRKRLSATEREQLGALSGAFPLIS